MSAGIRMRFRLLLATCLAWGSLASMAQTPVPVPAALDDWRDWVLHPHPEAACPIRDGDELVSACRWPGELQLDVDAQGARFEQSWTLYAPQRVPLPGDTRHRPIEVEVDGRVAPVASRDEGWWLALEPGTHRVRGRIDWSRRPSTLAVPAEIALFALRVDGVALLRPERNEDGELVLGAADAGESDALQMEVHRLLADGVPQLLATRIHLSVSGQPREVGFAAPLPPGFVPVALDGEIPARLDADGRLRLQLRSGGWSVTLFARALTPQTSLRRPAPSDDWPAQEIWQFRSDPMFRSAQLTGLPGVDPNQVNMAEWEDTVGKVPSPWDNVLSETDDLPAFLFDAEAEATLDIALRGLPPQRPSRLSLARELWLDFDGGGFSARDRIHGELGSATRLDLREPWSMQRAQSGGTGLLITQAPDDALHGVELRDGEVNLEIDARVARAGLAQGSGWTQAFDQASAVLNLPPGYRLIAATGADQAGGSWWQAWNLLDLFLLSLIVLLAWRLGGIALGALALAAAALAWHEPDAPQMSVLFLLAFALLAKHVVAGGFGRALRGMRALSLGVAALLTLAFAATELRLALYPQLEHATTSVPEWDYSRNQAGMVQAVMEAPMPAAAPAPPMDRANVAQEEQNQRLEKIEVTGSRIKQANLFSYPADAIVQNGVARPDWHWQRHDLSWNGPLLADDEVGLILSPPLLTRLWRVAAVALLLLLLWRVARPGAATVVSARAAAAAILLPLLAVGWPMPLQAQATPDSERLDELRNRLLAHDELCRPQCAALGRVWVNAEPGRLRLALQAEAQADVVWPLPRPDASLSLSALRVDGIAAAVRRDGDGEWVQLMRGVHRIEAEYVADGERWRLAFPLMPAALSLDASGFEAIGVDEGRLIGDTLELVPPVRVAEATTSDATPPSEAVPPFVRVRRWLTLDQHWEVATTVSRVAPQHSGINLALPLLAGEQPYQDAPSLRDGQAIVSLPAGVDAITWRSRLVPAPTYALVAGDGRSYAEEWLVTASPLLHLESSGLPESGNDADDAAIHRFLPLPGETLELTVTRPAALDGARFAIENVALQTQPGLRARDTSLTFQLRATQAGQHAITLPPEAELLSVHVDGTEQPRVLDAGKLRLPLRPGVQDVSLQWREPVALGWRMRTPEVALHGSASNLRIELPLPQDRWLLAASGPRVGPAVLIWGELLVLALAARMLARHGRTPLRFHHWLLLGLGFSTLSWWAAALVAAWLLAVAWRARRADLVERRVFPWLQLGLIGFSALALLALVIAVPYGLLGRPDMHVAGNGSSLHALHWFADRSADGVLPVARAISLPLWIYKLAILAWSMWLANALIGWLRWAFASLGQGGWWRPIFRRKAVTAPAVTPAAAAE